MKDAGRKTVCSTVKTKGSLPLSLVFDALVDNRHCLPHVMYTVVDLQMTCPSKILPLCFCRIFQFEDFKRTKKRILEEDDVDCALVGLLVH